MKRTTRDLMITCDVYWSCQNYKLIKGGTKVV
uniref:Uncharacterized protein n=1 Tax=Arundo donax TaxID=35708 RepID=A0A0A9BLF4_ARUDO